MFTEKQIEELQNVELLTDELATHYAEKFDKSRLFIISYSTEILGIQYIGKPETGYLDDYDERTKAELIKELLEILEIETPDGNEFKAVNKEVILMLIDEFHKRKTKK